MTCPSLGNFWTSVFQALSEILHHRIAQSLDWYFWHCFLAFVSLLARRAISLKWKDPAPHSYSHWTLHYSGIREQILQNMVALLGILWETFNNNFCVALPPFSYFYFIWLYFIVFMYFTLFWDCLGFSFSFFSFFQLLILINLLYHSPFFLSMVVNHF